MVIEISDRSSALRASQVSSMSLREKPRLLFVHAHPDDESLTTGGTIARYVAHGAQVAVVTCTLGEEGKVIDDRYALLTVDHADQLGGYRIGELTAALRALGVDQPIFLGGAGRWRDSGMPPTSRTARPAFVDAGEDAVGELVRIIDRIRPHVVVTYDPEGGYGHPDHVQAHRVTTAAVAASDWKVPKFYWTVFASGALRAASATGIGAHWNNLPTAGELGLGVGDTAIDAAVDVWRYVPAKVAALAAHATQIALTSDRRSCALSDDMVLPILTEEHYVLAHGNAGPRDDHGWETDLLGGLACDG